MDMMKAMYGCHAVQIPAWFYVQNQGDSGSIIVGASRDNSIRFGSKKTHQLFLGEIIARPHIVMESNAFIGYGSEGLLTANHRDFIDAKDMIILANPMELDPKKLF
jgi:hypothetical protein